MKTQNSYLESCPPAKVKTITALTQIRTSLKFLMMAFLLSNCAFTLKAQTEPSLDLETTITEEIPGRVYFVHFNPTGNDLNVHHDTQVVYVYMKFEFYDASDNLIYEQFIADSPTGQYLRYYAHKTNASGKSFWVPLNFTNDYAIYVPDDATCGSGSIDPTSISTLKITYNITGGDLLQSLTSTIHFPPSFGIADFNCNYAFNDGTPDCYENFEVTVAVTPNTASVPLQLML